MAIRKLLLIMAISLAMFVIPLTIGATLSHEGYDYPVLAYVAAFGGISFVICLVKLVGLMLRKG